MCNPQSILLRFSKWFQVISSIFSVRGRHPTARDLLLLSSPRPFFSMLDMQQQTAKIFLFPWQRPLFVVFANDSSKKDLKFWRRPFFGPLEWWRPAGTSLGLNVAH